MHESLLNIILNIIMVIIAAGSAIWVYKDTKRYKKSGIKIMSEPIAWGFLVFLLWLPFFPIYLVLKYLKYQKQLSDPNYQPNRRNINLIIGFFVIISIILIVFYLSRQF